jgi:ABC-2 type transport system permease protein
MLQGLIVFAISLIVGFRPVSLHLVLVSFVFMSLIALFFTALGTAIASCLEDMQGFQLIMNFLVMPLFFLSGALFPLKGLPKALVLVATVDPLSYGVDGLRGTLVKGAHFGLITDFLVLSVITMIILTIGSYLFSKIQI